MNRLVVFFSLLLMMVFIGSSQAGNKNKPDALAEINPADRGCIVTEISPFKESLLVSWEWSDGPELIKFGGHAVFEVNASIDDSTYRWIKVKIELVQYESGSATEDYKGQLVYRCSNTQSVSEGYCNGSVLGLEEALYMATATEMGVDVETVDVSAYNPETVMVKIKAMNPNSYQGFKRQNYPLVNICIVE